MRVSEKMFFQSNLDRLQKQAALVLKAEERSITGRIVNRASDDPVSATRILNFRKTATQIDQRFRNVDEAERFLSVTEEILKDVETQLHQASDIAIDMSSAFKTAQDRKNAVYGVQQILDQMVTLANTEHDGQSLFAGNKVKTTPFDLAASWKGQYVGRSLPPEGVTIQSHPDTLTPLDPNSPPNEILRLAVDGVDIQVILEDGVYDGDLLASELQTKINEHPDLQAKGLSVLVEYVLDDPENPGISTGHLRITSDTIGGKSSVVARPATGFKILSGVNDTLDISVNGELLNVVLNAGIYKSGDLLAEELKEQIKLLGQPVQVEFKTDHFLITPESGTPFVHPLPETLPFGDARMTLGFLDGKSQLSGEEYKGDDGEMPVLLSKDETFSKNRSGVEVFKGGMKDASGVDLFSVLLNFKAALEADDDVGIQTAITDMQKGMEQMGEERAWVGARLNRLQATQTALTKVKLSTTSFQSDIEDIDLTRAISELKQQQNTLEITRAIAARILDQPTLLNFLR